MSRGFEVTVEPSVLAWARKSAGYDAEEVTKVLKLKKDEINRWESGEERPTLSKLEKLATKYKRPLAVFFLPEPPKEKPFPKDFRTLPGKRGTPLSPETRLAIRRALRLQSLAKELMKSLGRETMPQIEIIRQYNPEIEAIKIRKMLGVHIQEQFAWKDGYEALRTWQKIIEKLGIFIFQESMPLEETRGFSLTTDKPPAIVLNTKDAINGRIFSLFHEYAHLLLNKGGMCDMEEVHLESEDALIEQFCNRLAGDILVQKDNLLNHRLVSELKNIDKWPDEILQKIATDFKVSTEVILRRLVLLGRAQPEFYKRKRAEWKIELEKGREQRKEKIKEKGFVRDIPHECLRGNSAPFVSLVLEAHAQEIITYNDVADYLRVRLKHVPKIEKLVRRQSLL